MRLPSRRKDTRNRCDTKGMKALVLLVLMSLPLCGQGFAYIGTYTRGASKGIYGFRYAARTGALTPLGLVAETDNPTFLAIHPNQRFLYAANEVSEGAITSYAIAAVSGA